MQAKIKGPGNLIFFININRGQEGGQLDLIMRNAGLSSMRGYKEEGTYQELRNNQGQSKIKHVTLIVL